MSAAARCSTLSLCALRLGHRIGSDVEHFRNDRSTRLFNGNDLLGVWPSLALTGAIWRSRVGCLHPTSSQHPTGAAIAKPRHARFPDRLRDSSGVSCGNLPLGTCRLIPHCGSWPWPTRKMDVRVRRSIEREECDMKESEIYVNKGRQRSSRRARA